MDITFEEVAHVIQDARYQQAIFDSDTPKPDRKIVGPGRNFNADEFVAQNKICLASLIAEPLGRFFLKSFVDPDPAPNTPSNESRILEFTEAMFNLRRRDPMGIVNAQDIIALLGRFDVTLPMLGKLPKYDPSSFKSEKEKDSSTGNGIGNDGEESSSSIASKDQVEIPIAASSTSSATTNLRESANLSSDRGASPAVRGVKKSEPDDVSVGGVEARVDIEREPGSKNAHTAWTETNVSRFEPNQNEEMTNPGGASTFGGNFSTTVNTYGAAAAAVVSRAAAAQKQHTQRSFDLNTAVQTLMETGLANVYARFEADKRSFLYYLKLKWYSMQPVGDKQIRYHRVLGTGAFGTVNGCIVACLGTMLAMKSMTKKRIKAKKAKSQVIAERQALEALAAHPSPYCMRLRYAYETKEAYHLILPLAIGGDLKYHLREGPFEENRAKIYAAEVALGLGHIHSLGLLIRDLKPRNILLNSQGHCQISDLGLAVSIADGRTYRGRAGTEGYWSPEVINNLHYSIDADWWAYGCCLFEFHTGFNPFSCKHTGLKTRNEGTRKAKIKFVKDFPESAKPLVLALLNRNVAERLGCRGKGVLDVLSEKHTYWKGVDLDRIRRNELPAPWTPEKGVIYALSQVEIQENDEDLELRKIKITEEDEIEFQPFTDFEDHQRDIVKVLECTINQQGVTSPLIQQTLQNEDEMSSCCDIS